MLTYTETHNKCVYKQKYVDEEVVLLQKWTTSTVGGHRSHVSIRQLVPFLILSLKIIDVTCSYTSV